jgi:SAM-dependent methyltransferase
MTERSGCPLCASAHLCDIPFGYRFEGGWLQAVRCRTCGIIFLSPQPNAQQLTSLYSREYFEGDFRCGHEGTYFNEATLKGLVDRGLLERIRAARPSGRFLEVGCAGGAFLDAARASGYDAAGVELSADAARFARDRFQLDVRTGTLKEAKFPGASFDVVYAGDVIEHLPDPARTAAEMHRVLNRGGVLVLACPTQTNTLYSRLGFTLYRALGKRAEVQLPPYHLFEYRPGSLRLLLETSGFAIIRMEGSALAPGNIARRGPPVQRLAKQLFQYPNWLLTRITGIAGDRLEVFAQKS